MNTYKGTIRALIELLITSIALPVKVARALGLVW
jgi:hypothetical protein